MWSVERILTEDCEVYKLIIEICGVSTFVFKIYRLSWKIWSEQYLMMRKCLPTPSFSISEKVNCLGEWSDASLWLGTLQHCDGSLKASFPAMAEKK